MTSLRRFTVAVVIPGAPPARRAPNSRCCGDDNHVPGSLESGLSSREMRGNGCTNAPVQADGVSASTVRWAKVLSRLALAWLKRCEAPRVTIRPDVAKPQRTLKMR